MDWESRVARALLLCVAANATPVALARVLGERGNAPLDLGLVLRDGRRLFGDHKTWRGLAGGTAAAAAVGRLLGLSWADAASFGALALLGDAASSALKRRLNLPSGTEVPGIDQLPETLIPLTVFARRLGLDVGSIVLITSAFAVLDILTARIRHLDRGRPP